MGQKYIKSIILYAVLGVLCFFNIRQLWTFALIFLGLTVFYVWLTYRHWNDEPDMTDRLKEAAKRSVMNGMKSGKSRKERKEQYQAYLSDIEDEFDMSDYEDDDYEDSEG